MKTVFAALLASGVVLAAGASAPALAGSAMSDAFVANAASNVDFLDSASRLALTKTRNVRLRAFAHDEAMEQTLTGNQFVAWTEVNTHAAVAQERPAAAPVATVDQLAAEPLDVAANVTRGVTTGVGDVLTGRSVAVAGQPAPVVASTPLPADRHDMDRLRAASGRDFDALYRSTQRDSLGQLATLYRSYIASGDNPALRAIAQRELPRVEHRLDQLRRL